MKQFYGLMMAKSLDECRAHFLDVDGQIGAGSLDQLRVVMSRFTIVGKTPELSGGGWSTLDELAWFAASLSKPSSCCR